MAYVTTKKKDSKYAHLEKLYNNDDKEVVITKEDSEEDVVLKTEETKIPRRDIYKDIALAVFLGLLGISGYLIFKIPF